MPKRLPERFQVWIDARKRHHLSHAQDLYFKRFGKLQPDEVVSIEERFRREEKKKAAKREAKLLRRDNTKP